jgi:hypothetical protein
VLAIFTIMPTIILTVLRHTHVMQVTAYLLR